MSVTPPTDWGALARDDLQRSGQGGRPVAPVPPAPSPVPTRSATPVPYLPREHQRVIELGQVVSHHTASLRRMVIG